MERETVPLSDSVRRLTYDELRAGKPCPGCGRAIIDEQLWTFKGLVHLDDAERTRYDAEESAFRDLHPDCHAYRWSMEGSLTTHCGECCPPAPVSPRQVAELTRIMATINPTPPAARARELRGRTVHVYLDDWTSAKKLAAARGEDVHAVVRAALSDYLKSDKPR